MTDVLARAVQRKQIAEHILSALGLIEKWGRYGRPVVVGAIAYDLVVAPDIDMEVYCPDLRVEHGFEVLRECAQVPGVVGARFRNELAGPDKALYWQLNYRHADGEDWKIDMWSAPEDYDLPRSEHFVGPMLEALTPETRRAILELKEARARVAVPECLSIDLYRAVLDDHVRTESDLRRWLDTHETGQLTGWKPRPRS